MGIEVHVIQFYGGLSTPAHSQQSDGLLIAQLHFGLAVDSAFAQCTHLSCKAV
jgi:hypothetical protein